MDSNALKQAVDEINRRETPGSNHFGENMGRHQARIGIQCHPDLPLDLASSRHSIPIASGSVDGHVESGKSSYAATDTRLFRLRLTLVLPGGGSAKTGYRRQGFPDRVDAL